MKPVTRVRGVRSPLPSGTLIGRSDGKGGPPHPVKAGKGIKIKGQGAATTVNADFSHITGDVSISAADVATVLALLGVELDFAAIADTFVLTYDAGSGKIIFAAGGGGGGGVTDFTDLGDVPASYTGQTLKAVRVNAGETALEFYTPAGGGGSGYDPGTPPTIVQFKADNSGGTSVTLDAPPTNGNRIIAMHFNPTVNTLDAAYTSLLSNGSGTDYGTISYHDVGVAESATQTVLGSSPGGTGVIMLWEIAGSHATNFFLNNLTEGVQAETNTYKFNIPLLLKVYPDTICLQAVAVVTAINIDRIYNNPNQDGIAASSGNRRYVAGHGDLSDFSHGGISLVLSANGTSKGCTAIIG